MQTWNVLIKIAGRSPQRVQVDARNNTEMRDTVHRLYGYDTTIMNYTTV